MGYLYIAGTLAFSVYGQLIARWRIHLAGDFPGPFSEKLEFLLRQLGDPWIMSTLLAGLLAALCWFAALTQFDLSKAYPFMGLSFVLVLFLSAAFFGEPLTTAKVLGVCLIVTGIAIAAPSS